MLALSLLLLSAGPAPLKVAVPHFDVINVSPESAAFFMDRFGNRLRSKGLVVTTATEIDTVLGLERQKSLLGCGEASSCQAEIAAALGADAILRARIARFGARFELSLTLIDPTNAGVIASISASAADEGKVLEVLDGAADELGAKLNAAKHRPAAIELATPGPAAAGRPAWLPLVPLGLGLGAGVVGAASLVNSYEQVGKIADAANPDAVAQEARIARVLGMGLMGVGVAGIATAAILFFTGKEPVATPVAMISQNGAWVGFEGRLP